jgi:ABC transporter substrate binding protein
MTGKRSVSPKPIMRPRLYNIAHSSRFGTSGQRECRSMNIRSRQNLSLRPARPALKRGRVQRACRRATVLDFRILSPCLFSSLFSCLLARISSRALANPDAPSGDGVKKLLEDLFRRAADIVDKILRGAKPSDIPVEQPTKLDLVINLTTAKTLGLEIPPKLLALADEVIA